MTQHGEEIEQPELVERYLHAGTQRARSDSAQNVSAMLDPVAPGLVGKCDVAELYRCSIRCVRLGLALTMRPDDGRLCWPMRLQREPACALRPTLNGGAAVVRLPPDDAVERLQRRGAPSSHTLSEAALAVARELRDGFSIYGSGALRPRGPAQRQWC